DAQLPAVVSWASYSCAGKDALECDQVKPVSKVLNVELRRQRSVVVQMKVPADRPIENGMRLDKPALEVNSIQDPLRKLHCKFFLASIGFELDRESAVVTAAKCSPQPSR